MTGSRFISQRLQNALGAPAAICLMLRAGFWFVRSVGLSGCPESSLTALFRSSCACGGADTHGGENGEGYIVVPSFSLKVITGREKI